jgi:hypothetical protein
MELNVTVETTNGIETHPDSRFSIVDIPPNLWPCDGSGN